MLITDPIQSHARSVSNKTAIISEHHSITYGQLAEKVDQVAHQLIDYQRMNPKQEQYKLGLLMRNRMEFLIYFLGAAKTGWIAVPMDPKWSLTELESSLSDVQLDILAIDGAYTSRLPEHLQGIRLWIQDDGSSIQFSSVLKEELTISDQSAFYMGFTSGTTGRPKGFIRSHRSWVKSFEGSQAEFGFSREEYVLVPGPLVHSTFLYAAIHTLNLGATVVLLEKFSAQKSLEFIRKYPITVLYVVPTMFEALAVELEDENRQLEGVGLQTILSAGAKWSTESKQKVSRWFPDARLFEFYGASELSFITVLGPEGNRIKPNSVGRPFHQVQISIRNSEGQQVKLGEVGKLFVKSELVFSGYFKNEEETKSVLQEDGWATVHDLASQDKEGYIFLEGREKNMIISGGLNVYPEEVEKVLKQLPSIDEAVVLGIPNDYWGEKVVAIVRLKGKEKWKARDIRAYCRKYLAAYKCPREVRVLEDIPLTTSGKVARQALKDLLLAGGRK